MKRQDRQGDVSNYHNQSETVPISPAKLPAFLKDLPHKPPIDLTGPPARLKSGIVGERFSL